MTGFPGFEARRIFSKKNTFWLVLFFLLAQYFVYFGVARYKKILSEREAFIRYERLKVQQYLSYEQYGSFGFRVLLEPLPLMIFCHSSILPLESTVNVKDIVDIHAAYKGSRVFPANGRIGDFAGVFFILGSLLIFYFGLNTFVSVDFIRFHSTWRFILGILSTRLILLILFFSAVMASSYVLALVSGIAMTAGEKSVLFGFFSYILVYLLFFFALGLLLSVVVRFRKELATGTYLLWFILVVAVPVMANLDLERRAKQIYSNELVNIKKLKNGKDLERKADAYFKKLQDKKVKEIKHIARGFFEEYINRVVPLNNRVEEELSKQVRQVVTYHENISAFWPTLFYSFLAREIPGGGFHAYMDFLDYVMKLRERFYSFYREKRYNQTGQSVEPFTDSSEMIFVLQSSLPGIYWQGTGFALLYTLLSLSAFFVMVRRLVRVKKNATGDGLVNQLDIKQLEPGKTYFRYCPDPVKKNDMIEFMESSEAVIMSKPDSRQFDAGVSLRSWLRFESQQKKLDIDMFNEALSLLRVEEQHQEQRIHDLDDETFLRAYLALELSRESNIYVFDDVLERGSRELENEVKSTFEMIKPHAIVIYLSRRLYDVSVKGRIQSGHDELRLVKVDWKDISLR